MKRFLIVLHSLQSVQRGLCSSSAALSSSVSQRPRNLLELCGVSIYDQSLASDIDCEYAARCGSIDEDDSLVLQRCATANTLQLLYGSKSAIKERPFSIDFNSNAFKKRLKEARTELVYKAIGSLPSKSCGGDIVVDLTAGLGRDSMVLAACGYRVLMCERNPVLYLLLKDALERLRKAEGGQSLLASRVALLNYDSQTPRDSGRALTRQTILDLFPHEAPRQTSADRPIYAYMDPMYAPNSVGRRSLVKKETQILHRLVGDREGDDEANNEALLTTALAIAKGGKVVVKRAVNAPPLRASLGLRVTEITGSTQRFDIINVRELQ